MDHHTPKHSELDDTASVPCISCRLRRKKCDRTLPICGRCTKLGIPPEQCIYRGSVGLHEKDSRVTRDRETEKNRELKRQLEHEKLVLRLLRHGQETRADKPLFFSGLRLHIPEKLAQLPGVDGYLGSISLPATVYIPQKYPSVINLLFSFLAKERQKYAIKKSQGQQDTKQALTVFEESCVAALAVMEVSDGDAAIKSLVNEISSIIPHREQYLECFQIFREANSVRYVMGIPRYSPELFDAAKNTVQFDEFGEPHISDELTSSSTSIIVLSLTLTILSTAHFVLSRRIDTDTSVKKVNSAIYGRYAAALLNINAIGSEIVLDDPETSLLVTLSLLQIQLCNRHTATTSFKPSNENPQATVLKMRQLIARAKNQHIHEEMEKFYPDMSKDDVQMYKDLWHCLVLLDIVDSLELGYISQIRFDDFRAGGKSDVKVLETMKTMHEVLTELNELDGELTAEGMLEYTLIGINKIKKAYLEMEGSYIQDFEVMLRLNMDEFKEGDKSFEAFYHAAERQFIRAVIMSMLQSLYSLCYRCCEQVGETRDSSERARAYHIIGHKYSYCSVEASKRMRDCAFIFGNDYSNRVGQTHILWLFQMVSTFEAGGLRATMWVGAAARDVTQLDNDELTTFLMYHRDDREMDWAIVNGLSRKRMYAQFPSFDQLLDFEIDDDHDRIIKKMDDLSDTRIVVYFCGKTMLQNRDHTEAKYINLGFLNFTRTYILCKRYSSMGLRYWFPREVKRHMDARYATGAENPVTPKTPKTPLTTKSETSENSEDVPISDFAGTFREMYEEVIETSQPRQFDLGAFFGANFDQILQETGLLDNAPDPALPLF